jgi:hypothetical protein
MSASAAIGIARSALSPMPPAMSRHFQIYYFIIFAEVSLNIALHGYADITLAPAFTAIF